MSKVQKYPLDFDALQKGDVIPADQLERVVGERKGTPAYEFKVLGLRDEIEEACGIVCRCIGGDLTLLTDEQLDAYTVGRTTHHVAALSKQARRRSLIDRSAMDSTEKAAAEARDRRVAYVAMAARKALRESISVATDTPSQRLT